MPLPGQKKTGKDLKRGNETRERRKKGGFGAGVTAARDRREAYQATYLVKYTETKDTRKRAKLRPQRQKKGAEGHGEKRSRESCPPSAAITYPLKRVE